MGRNAGASVSHPLLPLREDFDKASPPDVAAWRDEGGTGYGEGVTSSDKIADGCTARFYRGKIWGFLGEIAYKLLTNAKGYGMLTASREGRRKPTTREYTSQRVRPVSSAGAGGKIWGFLGEIAYKLLTNAKGYGMLTASREGRRPAQKGAEK